MLVVQFKKFRPDAIIPKYQTPGSVGLDLHAAHDFSIRSGSNPITVMTGIGICLPYGYEAQVRPRSSLSRRGINVAIGTIDSDYRGEIGVCLSTSFLEDAPLFRFRAGERIAQLVISPVCQLELQEVPELEQTQRGTQGWGSTGRF